MAWRVWYGMVHDCEVVTVVRRKAQDVNTVSYTVVYE